MARLGMDVEQVRSAQTQLVSLHSQLTSLITSLGTQVSNAKSAWDGPDSTQFESEWNSQHRTALQNAAQAIEDFSRKLQNNIQAQEDTSNNYA